MFFVLYICRGALLNCAVYGGKAEQLAQTNWLFLHASILSAVNSYCSPVCQIGPVTYLSVMDWDWTFLRNVESEVLSLIS